MQDQQGKPVQLTNSYYTMLPIKNKKKLQTMPSNLVLFLWVFFFFFQLWAYTVKKTHTKKLKRRKIHVSNKILVDLNNEHSICCSMTINKEDLHGLMHYYIWDGRANFKYWFLTRMKDLLCFVNWPHLWWESYDITEVQILNLCRRNGGGCENKKRWH